MNQEKSITAKAWIIMDNITKQYWRGSNTMQKLQMASLTKMYTLYACLQLNQRLNIRPRISYIQVVPTTEVGTLAHLEVGEYLILEDLYYGLMLPSGNDAALLLAYYYGYWMGRADRFPNYEWKKSKKFSIEGKKKFYRIYLTRFIAYMNEQLVKKELGHSDTHFENPHGLPDKLQRSTAWEISLATMHFLSNKQFETIVNTTIYQSSYLNGLEILWENTNILLGAGYSGVKTGHTASAGNCLCSRKKMFSHRQNYDLVVVVLGCDKLQQRFTETIDIVDDFEKYLQEMKML